MVRGKVVLKRIENKINRQVSFSKRRNGLLKKAYELSSLCDVDVALIIFSTHGKLYEFCSSSSIQKTLERYKKYMCTTSTPEFPSDDPTSHNNYEEYLRLKARVEILQSSQRNLLGEDLNQLSTNELDQLESQINKSLRLIRSKKTQTLLDQLYDLTRKEQMLQESNHALRKRIQEFTREDVSRNTSNDQIRSPQQDDELFRSSGRETSLQIRFQQITSNTDMPSNSCVYPPTWA